MEEVQNIIGNLTSIFDVSTIPMYLLGLLVFVGSIIADLSNKNTPNKSWHFYVSEFIYTLIAIAVGISLSFMFELGKSETWIISIVCGMCGSTVMKKLVSSKETLADSIMDKIKDKINNK